MPDTAYAFLVTSGIAKGRIKSFDLKEARALAGVVDILTHENMRDTIKTIKFFTEGGPASNTVVPLGSPEIAYGGQTIAVVLANSYEVARDAAHRVVVDYEIDEPSAGFDAPGAVDQDLATQNNKHEDPKVGDFLAAYAAAPIKIDTNYSTPAQHHNPIELFATQCSWNGAQLTVHEPSQNVYGIKNGLAAQLGIDAGSIRVVSPFIGGAFGSKGSLTQRTAIIAIAARKLGRPVKLVPTREQGFTIATYRAETRHRIKLAASRDGKLQALSHDGFEVTSRPDPYAVAGTDASTRMYACPNIASTVTIVRADRSTPGFMRAPAETPYFFALESAMDELAVALDMDPVELRRVNDTQTEPIKGLPFTSRTLMPCFDQAAAAFGWSKRNRRSQVPCARVTGWSAGAAPLRPTRRRWRRPRAPAFSLLPGRQRPGRDSESRNWQRHLHGRRGPGRCRAAWACPYDKVSCPRSATPNLPPAPVAGGSISTASVCSVDGVMACDAIRARLGDNTSGPSDPSGGSGRDAEGSWLRARSRNMPSGCRTGPQKSGHADALYKGAAHADSGVPNCLTGSSSRSAPNSWKSACTRGPGKSACRASSAPSHRGAS